ncbi:hypothetical protein OUZ56_013016 [Daphnia magna]|uniref:Uncharacterized protein n=1 Tax=Daphnia magna TaxID=35525 RepID=A0ABQ9Z4N6_9CRUS|nr:hypothetical protein OUZ56_013016 [Daphnia magna]
MAKRQFVNESLNIGQDDDARDQVARASSVSSSNVPQNANSRCRWAIAERKRRRPQSARGSDVLFCAGAVYIQRAAMLHIKTRSVLINLTRHCLRPTSIGVLDDVVQLNANVEKENKE